MQTPNPHDNAAQSAIDVDPWGIQLQYIDAFKNRKAVSNATVAALHGAMQSDEPSPPSSPVRVVTPGQPHPWPSSGELLLEDGARLKIADRLPADLPLGYHHFRDNRTGRNLFIIASPGKCVLPPKQIWGWSCQLYATLSQASWGIGDLADLRKLAQWSREQGAGVLLLSPLCAAVPTLPHERSPYSPGSRRFRNPIYVHIPEVPGYPEIASQLSLFATSAAANDPGAPDNQFIDWDRTINQKMQALNLLWARFGSHPDFDKFCDAEGTPLLEYATWCVLAEQLGPDWRTWPAAYRQPVNHEVHQFAAHHRRRVRFHQWLQWILENQLAQAAAAIPLMQDMPIGVHPGGADAWTWQDVLATDVSVGAPPDVYNLAGQNWSLPPWIPHRLQAAEYQPFIQTIRAMLRHAGGLRIDHALGLFRLFWIPAGAAPAEGGYVRYPYEELLAIIALESHRAGAFIVGEDLGTTEPLVQEQLAAHAMLSYRLLWFETDPPSKYPKLSLAAVTTHDLPTVAGLWTGSDLRDQKLGGTKPNAEATAEIRSRLKRVAKIKDTSPIADVVQQTHSLLATAPSLIRIATLEDAVAAEHRPNLPGASLDWPNWSRPLPGKIESLQTASLPAEIARRLGSSTRENPKRGAVG